MGCSHHVPSRSLWRLVGTMLATSGTTIYVVWLPPGHAIIWVMVQAWASLTAGLARCMAIHGLTLASRSEGSRLVQYNIIIYFAVQYIYIYTYAYTTVYVSGERLWSSSKEPSEQHWLKMEKADRLMYLHFVQLHLRKKYACAGRWCGSTHSIRCCEGSCWWRPWPRGLQTYLFKFIWWVTSTCTIVYNIIQHHPAGGLTQLWRFAICEEGKDHWSWLFAIWLMWLIAIMCFIGPHRSCLFILINKKPCRWSLQTSPIRCMGIYIMCDSWFLIDYINCPHYAFPGCSSRTSRRTTPGLEGQLKLFQYLCMAWIKTRLEFSSTACVARRWNHLWLALQLWTSHWRFSNLLNWVEVICIITP